MEYSEIEYQAQLAYFRSLLKGSWNIDKPSIEKVIIESPFKYENEKNHIKMFVRIRDELFNSYKLDRG